VHDFEVEDETINEMAECSPDLLAFSKEQWDNDPEYWK
jgi:hypothetical protein